MNLDALRLFCEVVRYHSFSRGARSSGVSQAAASQTVAHLEADLDVMLIDRSKRPFKLTPEGEQYYEGVRSLLAGYDQVAARIQSTRSQIAGTVRVAAIYSVGLHVMSHHVRQFISDYPQARIRLEYLHPQKVIDAVEGEEADLGIMSYPTANRTVRVIPLRSEKMVFICRPDHKLARKERIEPHDLDGENFVAFDAELAIRKAIDRCLRRYRAEPAMAMEFDNIETIKQALEIGAGVSILPEPTVRREVARGSLVARPTTMDELIRPIGIIHRRRKRFTPAVSRFMELLQKPVEV
ncbi:MAG: LysR family transcriptional regulator [Planctomycetota bacterium]|nr:LysR family transcriptional regulator [Planctomycetota bacterium]